NDRGLYANIVRPQCKAERQRGTDQDIPKYAISIFGSQPEKQQCGKIKQQGILFGVVTSCDRIIESKQPEKSPQDGWNDTPQFFHQNKSEQGRKKQKNQFQEPNAPARTMSQKQSQGIEIEYQRAFAIPHIDVQEPAPQQLTPDVHEGPAV